MSIDVYAKQIKWIKTEEILSHLRQRANNEARIAICQTDTTLASQQPIRITHFASGCNTITPTPSNPIPEVTNDGHPFLTPDEEQLLIQFYSGKLPSLIGPTAEIPRLRKDVKVSATANLLFRRFFMSNSVMVHDPKIIMVAAAFLASKTEDATVDIRYLEEGTKVMKAPVSQSDIIKYELNLLSGINFELMCLHPYKTVLAYTEDLRTYLKSEKGRHLATLTNTAAAAASADGGDGDGDTPSQQPAISGGDLLPIHDAARRLVDDVCVSDIALLYTPGQIGLAALMVANDELQEKNRDKVVPRIDFLGYVKSRFDNYTDEEIHTVVSQTVELTGKLKDLRSGRYGCGNYGIDIEKLKAVHKKLKKCRIWGEKEEKKKKKKKRKRGDAE